MAKKIIILVVVLILVALFSWSFFTGSGPASKYDEFKSIESKHGVSDGVLTPGSMEELALFEAELKAFRRNLDNSSDGIALKILVDSRLDLIDMEEKFLQSQERTLGFNPFNPNCTAIAEINNRLDEGIAKAGSALEKRQKLMAEYSKQAATAGIESNAEFERAINGIINSIELLKEGLDSYC